MFHYDFKQKAILNFLKKTYDVDFVVLSCDDYFDYQYYLKIKFNNRYLYTTMAIDEDEKIDEVIDWLNCSIRDAIENFEKLLSEGSTDIDYLKKQIQLKARMEKRELLHEIRTSKFVYELYYTHEMDVLKCLNDIEKTGLDPYLKMAV